MKLYIFNYRYSVIFFLLIFFSIVLKHDTRNTFQYNYKNHFGHNSLGIYWYLFLYVFINKIPIRDAPEGVAPNNQKIYQIFNISYYIPIFTYVVMLPIPLNYNNLKMNILLIRHAQNIFQNSQKPSVGHFFPGLH